MTKVFNYATLVVAIMCLPACTIGPDFVKPTNTISAKTWERTIQNEKSTPEAVLIDNQWWLLFNDPLMTSIIDRAITNNYDLKIAMSRLLQSQAIRGIVGSNQYPSLDIGLDYSRQHRSQKGLNDPSGKVGKESFNLWSLGLNSAWELDLWDKLKRQREVAEAHVEMAENDQYAVQLAIISETASNYILLRGIQSTIEITKKNLAIAQKALILSEIRFNEGVSTRLDVEQASTQVATTQAQIPLLEAKESELINKLSLLLAEPPYHLKHELINKQGIPHPPSKIPVGLPSELTERRPDIRRANAELHAAIADRGIAKANFYPSINLVGSIGAESYKLNQLSFWSAHQFNVGPSIYLPIFEGGRLTGNLELKDEQAKEAAINYKKVVLNAWHEVENNLADFQAQQLQRNFLDQAVLDSRSALKYAGQQYKEGTTDYLHVLATQQALLDNQQKQIASDVAVSMTMVSIYKVLGGGWALSD